MADATGTLPEACNQRVRDSPTSDLHRNRPATLMIAQPPPSNPTRSLKMAFIRRLSASPWCPRWLPWPPLRTPPRLGQCLTTTNLLNLWPCYGPYSTCATTVAASRPPRGSTVEGVNVRHSTGLAPTVDHVEALAVIRPAWLNAAEAWLPEHGSGCGALAIES